MTTWRSPQNPAAADLNALEAAIGATEAGIAAAAGDLFQASAPGALQRLAVGSNGQVLQVVGGQPAWAALPPVDDTEDLALPGWGWTEAYR
ncbi:MAG: hypothetical protein KatS3mg063_1545 [Tepidiforma sp.]|uniref:hypothetical protein n=1 Tax=Tepidiforma sp. TaxID=2682230 RepID=UPI0021DB966C|nr:hypothetical protein [Tepidiforma sp.]GIW15692.1 MAG: hypothetical protein KatS3mg063_1545 [Tepidiforma sp.]